MIKSLIFVSLLVSYTVVYFLFVFVYVEPFLTLLDSLNPNFGDLAFFSFLVFYPISMGLLKRAFYPQKKTPEMGVLNTLLGRIFRPS